MDRQSDMISPDSALLNIKCVHNSSGKLHPTQKPVELYEYMVKTYTDEGEIVLDMTAGSETLAEACFNTNRDFIVIEKPPMNDGDPNYFEVMKERVEKIFKNHDIDLRSY